MKARTNAACRLICLLLAGLAAIAANAAQMERPYTLVSRFSPGGQLLGTIAPDPDGAGPLRYAATRYTYDTSGTTNRLLLKVESGELSTWLDETVAPASWPGFSVFLTTEYTYDTYGRKVTERLIGTNGQTESLTQYSYDTWSRVQCKAVRMNPASYGSPPASACTLGAEDSDGPDRIHRYTYDALDQVLTEERAVGTAIQQTYVTNTYSHRLLTSQSDANGNRTELRYDGYGRLKRRVYPSPTTAGTVNESDYNEYDYDNNGNLRYERKRNGASITNTYDANDRPIFKDLSDNTYSQDVSYDYDLRGLTLSSRFGSDAGEGITNTFDGFGELTSATTNVGGTSYTLSYLYDANGNRTRVTHPGGQFFQYGFDGLDRLTSVGESTSTSPDAGTSTMLTLDYHPGGGRWHIYRPGGTTTYLQDNVMRLESFAQDFAGSAYDLENAFTYNSASQATWITRSNDLYEMPSAVSWTGAYVPNGLNQYTNIAGQTITYDTDGNLTNDGSVTYTYDMENRLVAASGTVNGQSVTASFNWDPLGRLQRVTTNGTARPFLYDGDALVGEYNGSTLTKRYVHGDRVDEPLVQYDSATVGAGYRRYLHADHQGSIIALSSNSGGVLSTNAYDPYGIPSEGNEGRFGYTGQAWLKALGLYHYKARMYHPRLGRFLQTDPIFYEDDLNLYAYAGNDPLNKIDPTGLDSCETVNPDGRPGPRIPTCIGDPHGVSTPLAEAFYVLYEIEATAARIKKDRKTRSAINSESGEVGFKTELGQFTSVKLTLKCTKGNIEAFKFPDGFLTGAQSSAGHTHNRRQKSGIGPHDAAMALQTKLNIQTDSEGTRGIAKLSTGSAIAFSANGTWGEEGASSTAQAVLDLANATEGGSSNAPSTRSPCP